MDNGGQLWRILTPQPFQFSIVQNHKHVLLWLTNLVVPVSVCTCMHVCVCVCLACTTPSLVEVWGGWCVVSVCRRRCCVEWLAYLFPKVRVFSLSSSALPVYFHYTSPILHTST